MSRLKIFQKKLKDRTKLEVIKGLIQAFSVTVVAVIAVTVFIPKSPKASFDEVKVFSSEIIYQVSVTDEDNIVEDDQVKLILENQMENLEEVIVVGKNIGSFSGLKPNTKYNLKVVYDKGFGEEVLAKKEIFTKNNLVAAFGGFELLTQLDEYTFNYLINVLWGDVANYTNWQIRYASIYPGSTQEPWYETIYLSPLETNIPLRIYGISGGGSYHVILEAMFEGEMQVIDEVYLKPPFKLYASLYLEYYNDEEIGLNIYTELDESIDVSYIIELYKNGLLVRKIDYIPESGEMVHEGSVYVLEDLISNTDYSIKLIASYINPDTLREEEKVLGEESVHTLSNFYSEMSYQEFDNYYEVTIKTDSVHYDVAFYEILIYDEEYDYWYYYFSDDFELLKQGDYFIANFRVDKPVEGIFKIQLSMRSLSVNEIQELFENIEE